MSHDFEHEIYMGRRFLDSFENYMKSDAVKELEDLKNKYYDQMFEFKREKKSMLLEIEELQIKVGQQGVEIGRLLNMLDSISTEKNLGGIKIREYSK